MLTFDPVLKFDSTGKLVKSFGAGMMVFPHGIHVDKDGNVWYFGEDTATLDRHGRVLSTEGSFHAGVDGVQPGVVMQAHVVAPEPARFIGRGRSTENPIALDGHDILISISDKSRTGSNLASNPIAANRAKETNAVPSRSSRRSGGRSRTATQPGRRRRPFSCTRT